MLLLHVGMRQATMQSVWNILQYQNETDTLLMFTPQFAEVWGLVRAEQTG